MRWGRLARRLAIGLAAGLVLLVLIVLATLATGFGQRLVLAMALPAAESALGTAITVEETGGAWPGRIRLSGITLADEAGVFATIGRLELDWTARALLGDHVDIDRLAIAEVDLRRLPATQEDTEAPERPFALPDLPRIDVGALLLSDLRLGEAIVEGGGRIDARGSARLAGRRLEIALDAEPEGSPEEHARIHLLFAGRRAPVTADIDISAPPGGLIARLAGLPEGARLTLRGTGPAEDFGARIAGRLGGIATASGTLRCACAGPIDARLALTLASGPDAPESLASLLGEGTEIGLRLAREGEDLVLVLDAAGTGQGGGTLAARLGPGDRAERRPLALTASLAPAALADTDETGLLAPQVSLDLTGELLPEGLEGVDARLHTGALTLALTEGRYLGGEIGGALRLALAPHPHGAERLPEGLAPLLAEGGELTAEIVGRTDGVLRLADLSGRAGGGRLTLAGEASYDTDAALAGLSLEADGTADLLAALLPEAELEGPVRLAIDGTAGTDDLDARLTLTLPPGRWAGEAHGAGRLALFANGPPTAPDLRLSGALADPDGSEAGTLAGTVRLTDGTDALSADLTGRYRAARLAADADLALSPLSGNAAFRLSIEDAARTFPTAGALGSLDAQGTAELGGDSPVLAATVTSPSFAGFGLRLLGLEARAEGPLSALALTVTAGMIAPQSGEGLERVSAEARLAGTDAGTTVRLSRFAAIASGEELRLAAPAEARITAETLSLGPLTVSVGEAGRLTARASGEGTAFTAELGLQDLPLPPAGLRASGRVVLASDGSSLDLALVPLDPAAPDARLALSGQETGGRLALRGSLTARSESGTVSAPDLVTAALPFRVTASAGRPVFETSGPARIALAYEGAVAPLFAFANLPDQTLTGRLTLDATLAGPLEDLAPSGGLRLAGGTYEHTEAGILLSPLAVEGTVERAGDDLQLTADLTAGDGRGGEPGRIRGALTARLAEGTPRLEGTLALREARIVAREDLNAVVDGRLALATGPSGGAPAYTASGSLTIRQAEYFIPDSLPPSVVDLDIRAANPGSPAVPKAIAEEAAPASGPTLALAIELTGSRIFVRGRGLTSEWAADLDVTGTASDPRLDGALTLTRGNVELGGRRFELDRGIVAFSPLTEPAPRLDLQASFAAPDGVTALVTVTGRASEPAIALSSTPPRPEADVMALVLFGRPAADLTAVEGLRVAQAVAELTGQNPFGGGGPGLLDKVRQGLGVDTLDVDTSGDDPALTVGRYLTDDIFVSASQGLTGESGKISVESKISDQVSVKTDVGGDSSADVSVNWSFDY